MTRLAAEAGKVFLNLPVANQPSTAEFPLIEIEARLQIVNHNKRGNPVEFGHAVPHGFPEPRVF